MMTIEQEKDVIAKVDQVFAQKPDWTTFYREVLGMHGIVRRMFPSRDTMAAFEQTEAHQEILRMLTLLRMQTPGDVEADDEPTRVITVRLPKSMHETLRAEAYEHRTSMNKLCISKLLQMIDAEAVPGEP